MNRSYKWVCVCVSYSGKSEDMDIIDTGGGVCIGDVERDKKVGGDGDGGDTWKRGGEVLNSGVGVSG